MDNHSNQRDIDDCTVGEPSSHPEFEVHPLSNDGQQNVYDIDLLQADLLQPDDSIHTPSNNTDPAGHAPGVDELFSPTEADDSNQVNNYETIVISDNMLTPRSEKRKRTAFRQRKKRSIELVLSDIFTKII